MKNDGGKHYGLIAFLGVYGVAILVAIGWLLYDTGHRVGYWDGYDHADKLYKGDYKKGLDAAEEIWNGKEARKMNDELCELKCALDVLEGKWDKN